MTENLLPVYQTLGLPLRDILTKISNREWILPAIQREFVWSDGQICRLFDSMMRGYPFGTFLFWEISPKTAAMFKFYEFMRDHHEKNANTCKEIANLPTDRELTAVLDGQQRLTALNIGLNGSRAHKLPYRRRNSVTAYPTTYLHLDVLSLQGDEESELAYRFAFLTKDKAADESVAGTGSYWYRIKDILELKSASDVFGAWMPIVSSKNLSNDDPRSKHIYNVLSQLQRLVHETALVSCYRERNQELERVLDIFIRMNSGGTPLAKSDLLFSVAVANWAELDARKEVNDVVTTINETGSGFNFSKDFVLKAGLMLAGIASVGFKVENFDRNNMGKLEKAWPDIKKALLLTAQLVADFGFTGKTLRADSALLPIAFYLYQRKLGDDYLVSGKFEADRKAVRLWLIRSYLKPSGIWGSGLDTLLGYLREVIKLHGEKHFPIAEIELEMGRRGKALNFSEDEIQDLADEPYASDRIFPLLSLLFDVVDTVKHVHIDHVFPISRFSPTRLTRAGIAAEKHAAWFERANSLCNLQLLEGQVNQEKLAKLPSDWLKAKHTSELDRQRYLMVHDLGVVPELLEGFEQFTDERRTRLLDRIRKLIGVPSASTRQPEEDGIIVTEQQDIEKV